MRYELVEKMDRILDEFFFINACSFPFQSVPYCEGEKPSAHHEFSLLPMTNFAALTTTSIIES